MKNIFLSVTLLLAMSNIMAKSFDELVTDDDVKTEVKRLADEGDWRKLSQLEEYLNHENKVTDNGFPMVDIYYMGFREFIESQVTGPESWELLEKKARVWVTKFPKSPASHLALGEILQKHAWKIRGNGVASTVSEPQWEGLHKYTEMLRNHLLANRAIASRDPEWYTLMLAATKTLSLPESEYGALLNEGLTKFPNYYRLYFNASVVRLPKWGGSMTELEALLNKAAARFDVDKGDQIYALTYIRLLEEQLNSSYEPTRMNCDRVIRGSEKFSARFPTPYNYGNTVYIATICGKKDIAKKYFTKVGDIPANAKLWGGDPETAKVNFDRVKALAE